MPPLVDIGTGTTVTFGTSAFSAQYHGPIDFGGLDRSAIDVTHMGTTLGAGKIGGRKKILPRLANTLEVTGNIHFNPDTVIPSNQGELITITFPNGEVWSFQGAITSMSAPIPLEDKMTATITIKAKGLVTIS